MNVEQKITRLQQDVRAALDEFEFVIRLYETWRPAAFDQDDLFERMGPSFASHAFLLIREALAREIVLGLTKLWDGDNRSISMARIAQTLRTPAVIRGMAAERAGRFSFPGVDDAMARELAAKVDEALAIIDRYSHGGLLRAVHDGLQALRNTRFAHRQVVVGTIPTKTPTADEVEAFYQDMSSLMQLLASLVLATAYDLRETAEVRRFYAAEFWAGVRGEKTIGHPRYRKPPSTGASPAV